MTEFSFVTPDIQIQIPEVKIGFLHLRCDSSKGQAPALNVQGSGFNSQYHMDLLSTRPGVAPHCGPKISQLFHVITLLLTND